MLFLLEASFFFGAETKLQLLKLENRRNIPLSPVIVVEVALLKLCKYAHDLQPGLLELKERHLGNHF